MSKKIPNEILKKLAESVKNFPKLSIYRSEANTKKRIVEPLLEILGWNLRSNEVLLEYPVTIGTSTSYVDYALILEDKPVVLVEAKPIDEILSDKHSYQIISYGKVQDVKWTALSNGRVIKVFNTEEGKTEKECLVVEINLETLPKQAIDLFLLSRESILTGEIENAAKRMSAMRKAIHNLNQKKSDLEKEFKNLLIKITGKEIESQVEKIASQLVEQTIQLFETQPEERIPPPKGKIQLIVRKELSTKAPGEVIICPSRVEGVDFLQKYNAWGFVYIGKTRNPKYFALYVGVPESSVLYFGDIGSITQPLKSKEELRKIQEEDLETFQRGKRVIHLKPETLVKFKDPISLKTRRGGLRGIKYTTLEKLIKANYTDEL